MQPGVLWPAGCTHQVDAITCSNTVDRPVGAVVGNNPVQVCACQAVRALPVVPFESVVLVVQFEPVLVPG